MQETDQALAVVMSVPPLHLAKVPERIRLWPVVFQNKQPSRKNVSEIANKQKTPVLFKSEKSKISGRK